MIDPRRLERALIAGLLPVLAMALWLAFTPTVAMSLAGDPDSPGARLALDDSLINRLALGGDTVEGENVARLEIGRLRRSADLVIERDVLAGSVVPGAGVYTLRVEAPVTVINDVDLFTSRACVRGVGLTRFGLLQGVFEPSLNQALADGFRPNLVTFLLNLIGPSGLIDFTIAEFRGELVRLDARLFTADRGVRTTFTPRVTSPSFQGSCL